MTDKLVHDLYYGETDADTANDVASAAVRELDNVVGFVTERVDAYLTGLQNGEYTDEQAESFIQSYVLGTFKNGLSVDVPVSFLNALVQP